MTLSVECVRWQEIVGVESYLTTATTNKIFTGSSLKTRDRGRLDGDYVIGHHTQSKTKHYSPKPSDEPGCFTASQNIADRLDELKLQDLRHTTHLNQSALQIAKSVFKTGGRFPFIQSVSSSA